MTGWCDICGKKIIPASKAYSYEISFSLRGTKRNNVCEECANELDPVIANAFNEVLKAEEKLRELAKFRKHLAELMLEEQELDAWKADIYGGDEQ